MKILDRLPIPQKRTSLTFGDKHATVHRNQAAVWVSVDLDGVDRRRPEPNIPRFPAAFWTRENNVDFSVQDRHLRDWAGLDPELLAILGDIEINGPDGEAAERLPWFGCTRTSPGEQDVASDEPPFRLRRSQGIALSTSSSFAHFIAPISPARSPIPRSRLNGLKIPFLASGSGQAGGLMPPGPAH